MSAALFTSSLTCCGSPRRSVLCRKAVWRILQLFCNTYHPSEKCYLRCLVRSHRKDHHDPLVSGSQNPWNAHSPPSPPIAFGIKRTSPTCFFPRTIEQGEGACVCFCSHLPERSRSWSFACYLPGIPTSTSSASVFKVHTIQVGLGKPRGEMAYFLRRPEGGVMSLKRTQPSNMK